MNLIHYQWFQFMNVFALTFKCICVGTHAFNTYFHNNNNVGCIYLCFVKNHTWKFHQNWNMTKIRPKKMEIMLYLFIITLFFESQTHIFLLPPFTYMSNKLCPIKTLTNPIHFQNFRNLFTSIHAYWVTFNYDIYANHAFNPPWQQASWTAYICMWLKSFLETSSHSWQQENWVASICMRCKSNLETTSTPHGKQENWVASICMWCTSNLKIMSTFCGKKVGLHSFICGANQTWKLYQQPMAIRKLGCIHLYVE